MSLGVIKTVMWKRSSGVLLQEGQGLLIKLVDLLIERRMRAPFEDHQIRTLDAICHPLGKTGRRHHIILAKANLRRRLDLADYPPEIVKAAT